MKKIQILFITAFIVCPLVQAAEKPGTLDELVEQVLNERFSERKESQERLERFRQEHDRQEELLEEAKAELEAAEHRSGELRSTYDQNERLVSTRESDLNRKMGSLGELHGVVRQVANDMDAVIDTSLVSAQIGNRDAIIDKLADSKALPEIAELENLWHVALEEMVEAGKIVTFPGRIITNDGKEVEQDITRVGVFSAVSNGRFLRYLTEADHLVEPGRQPSARYQSLARDLESSKEGIQPFPVDPTRGSVLSLLVQVPDLKTRIQQGGIVGYIIITLGMVGLLLALLRFITLGRIDRQINKQQKTDKPGDNPLGRIMAVYQSSPNVDTETLELKLDEAILHEMPVLQRGLRIIALLAEVALLLGLLGTVTGIIETFQSITLFGTGDPRVMSGGISQALVTTVMGLITSIPLLLLHSFLSSRSNRLIHTLDENSAALVARLAEAHHGKA